MILLAEIFWQKSEAIELDLDDSITVDELRETIAAVTEIPAVSQKLHILSLIIYPGQYVNDEEMKLKCFDLASHIKIFVVRVKLDVSSATKMLAKPELKVKKPLKSLSMNDFLSKDLQNFFLDSLASNPEQIADMLKSSSLGKKFSKNPQLMKALGDPEMVKDVLRSIIDPEVRNDTMRNLELRMHHISNMGGESMIRNVFADYLNDSDDGSEVSSPKHCDLVNVCDEDKAFDHRKNIEPLPNPWEGREGHDFTAKELLPFPSTVLMSKEKNLSPHLDKGKKSPSQGTLSHSQEQFSSQLQELHTMGFHNDAENVAALLRSHGDVNEAVLFLLSSKDGS